MYKSLYQRPAASAGGQGVKQKTTYYSALFERQDPMTMSRLNTAFLTAVLLALVMLPWQAHADSFDDELLAIQTRWAEIQYGLL